MLTEGKKATEGVVVRNIKTYLEKQFKRNIANKQFSKRLDTAIQQGISQGQFIKTSPKGRALSITLNLHFNPDDSRGKTIHTIQQLVGNNPLSELKDVAISIRPTVFLVFKILNEFLFQLCFTRSLFVLRMRLLSL